MCSYLNMKGFYEGLCESVVWSSGCYHGFQTIYCMRGLSTFWERTMSLMDFHDASRWLYYVLQPLNPIWLRFLLHKND